MADPATPHFHYPPAAEHTGRVQYRYDRLASAQISSGEKVYGIVSRGQVVEMKQGLAERVVTRGGDFSHVAADTPLGVPEEYRPGKRVTDPATAQPAATPAATVPLMITAQMRVDLGTRGYSREQIDAMTPQQAHDILSEKVE